MDQPYKRPLEIHRSHSGRGTWEKPIPSVAYVQAYEAQLIYDEESRVEELYSLAAGASGRGLMRWHGDQEVWTDRHDIIHLIDELPSGSGARPQQPSPTPSSSSSWDDLPSDLEETLHISDPGEFEAYQRTKRTRWMEELREARLREREEEDREEDKGKAKATGPVWPENEIAPQTITTLMSHTAASLLASPNPQILKSRILLNHATDDRFDFLKGRWKLTWDRTQKDARARRDIASGKMGKEKKKMTGLVGAYDSESESEEEEVAPPPVDEPPAPPVTVDEDLETPNSNSLERRLEDEEVEERQRLRRLKAEEWKRKRAEAQRQSTNTAA